MEIDIYERAVEEGKYIIDHNATIRQTAKHFGIGKSPLYHHVSVILKQIDLDEANKVNEVLQFNKSVRHIRGGEATKIKMINLRKQGK